MSKKIKYEKNFIAVKHNIEVAHRLFGVSNKCENIHGHSMWITIFIQGSLDELGMVRGLDFGHVKRTFREHLDTFYDHRLLLHNKDPFAQRMGFETAGALDLSVDNAGLRTLPGLNAVKFNPTTENIAKHIGLELSEHDFGENFLPIHSVEVWETSVNMARWQAAK